MACAGARWSEPGLDDRRVVDRLGPLALAHGGAGFHRRVADWSLVPDCRNAIVDDEKATTIQFAKRALSAGYAGTTKAHKQRKPPLVTRGGGVS